MKSIVRILPVLLLAAACSGENLVNGDTPPNKSFTLETLPTGTPDDNGIFPSLTQGDGSKVFQNGLGVTITLEAAGISWGHVQLISEGNDPECEAGHDVELHVERIENLIAAVDLQASPLSATEIADYSYCQYRVELTPENSDSPGLSGLSEIAGSSIYAKGTWDFNGAGGAFEVKSAEEIELTREFVGQSGHAHPLHYHEGEEAKTVRFAVYYDQWFEGVDFSESEAVLSAEVSANVLGSIKQYHGASAAH